MAESWEPQEDSLRQILQLLKEAQSCDEVTQGAAQQALENLINYSSDFNKHLIHVLTKLTPENSVNHKICEDSLGDEMEMDEAHFDVVIPKLLQFSQHSKLKIRSLALACISQFIKKKTQAVITHMDDLLQELMRSAADNDAEVRWNSCRALTLLLDSHTSQLVPRMDEIIKCILDRTQDANDTVSLEACEFWLSLTKQINCKDAVRPYLALLLPILLQAMRFSEMGIFLLKADDEGDEPTPDKQDGMQRRVRQFQVNVGEQDYKKGALSDWNLRKCSAVALEELSKVFKDELIPVLLPLLKETLSQPAQWRLKEAGVLALGAISEGCKSGMVDHLTELFPMLISCLSEKEAAVKAITFWTLSRYADWVVGQPHDEYLKPLLTEFLKRILDGDRFVQQSACSSLATFQEEAGSQQLVPYLGNILEVFVDAYGQYQQRNSLLCLYDAIGALARSVGSHLNNPDFITLLMPPLIFKFNVLKDDDKDLIPLLDCLSSVAPALQSGFLRYSESVFRRCISLIEQALSQHIEPDGGWNGAPNKDFLVAALDLISGLAEGLGSHVESLIVSSNIMHLLRLSMEDIVPEVRQSSFAVLGDLTKACFDQVVRCLPELLPILGQNLNPEFPLVCINAIWALGEIAVKFGNEMHIYVSLFLDQLISTINRPTTPKNLMINTAVTLGRLGFVCPRDVAPHLQQFTERWFASMFYSQEGEEKDTAFRGMCNMIAINRNGIIKDFFYFCKAISSWNNPRSDLKEQFVTILESFKGRTSDENWNRFLGQLEPPLREKMMRQYGV